MADSTKKNNITKRETAAEQLKECYKMLHFMQPDYDKRDKLIINYLKKSQHKAILFFMAFFIVGFYISNSLPYPFLPENLRFLGVLVSFIITGVVLPVAIYFFQKRAMRLEKERILRLNKELESFYKNRNLTEKLNIKYSNPRVIKKCLSVLESKRAHSIDEAIDFTLAEYQKMSLFGLQKKPGRSDDDIALFAAAHADEIC